MLSFSRVRYETVQRKVSVEEGHTRNLVVRMQRPEAALVVTSTPPGASVRVNGQRKGITPQTVPVWRFQSVDVQVSTPGRPPFKRRAYVKGQVLRMHANLVNGRR
jgi:hypothetical protein